MEREQLKSKAEPVIPIGPDPVPPADKAAKLPPGAVPISVDNINGQIQELSEQNSHLVGRCAQMRGRMADMQRQLADQTQVIMTQTARIAELEGQSKSSLKKRNGR